MQIINLRNKYFDNPYFIPLLEYCNKNCISFEMIYCPTDEGERIFCMFNGQISWTYYNSWVAVLTHLISCYRQINNKNMIKEIRKIKKKHIEVAKTLKGQVQDEK